MNGQQAVSMSSVAVQASGSRRIVSIANVRPFVRTCIRSLLPLQGEKWNSNWKAAGFTAGSLAVPDNPLTLLEQLGAYYYIANPAREATVQGIATNPPPNLRFSLTISAPERSPS